MNSSVPTVISVSTPTTDVMASLTAMIVQMSEGVVSL